MVVVCFVVIVIFLGLFFFSSSVNNSTTNTTQSIFSYFAHLRENTFTSFSNFGTYFESKKILNNENVNLKNELNDLKTSLFSLDALRDENLKLKEELGRKFVKNSIIASVLARPTLSPYDTLIIDVGSDDGISVGDKVVVGNELSIGMLMRFMLILQR